MSDVSFLNSFFTGSGFNSGHLIYENGVRNEQKGGFFAKNVDFYKKMWIFTKKGKFI